MPALVRIIPWADPVLDTLGHDPRSWYAETFWLPTLGPTALLLLRHLADRFEQHPKGLTLPVAETAAALGLGPRDGEQSPLVRSLGRLRQFELAHAHAPEVIAVRRTLPPIHRRHVRRLPPAVQERHREWIAGQSDGDDLQPARHRARRIALALLMDGDTFDAVERALHRCGFHPVIGHEAVQWAYDQHRTIL
jgi:hypothetical protein